MFSGYSLTESERKIEKMYKKRNILTPLDLEIQNVANLFDVELDFSINGGPQRAIWNDETAIIFLDPGLPEEKQREVFYHELAHPLLHSGDQTQMKYKTFRELQETQANQFQLYAAIPFFMLQSLDLPNSEYQIVDLIKTVFKVSPSLAKKRLEQIKRRILQTKIDNQLFNDMVAESDVMYESKESFPLLEDLFTPNEIQLFITPKVSKKPKVYYDIYEGKPIALWYCIEVKHGEVNWGKKMHLYPIDMEFEFTHIKEFENKESDSHVFELMLHPSHPNDFAIDLNPLKEKLKFFNVDPYNIRRFVIGANQLEELLQLNIFSSRLIQLAQ